MSEYIDSEMDVELSKINQIFEKFNPPETELGKAVKYYKWEHKEQSDLNFSFSLGILEYQLALSVKKIRADKIEYLLLIRFRDCCDKLEVINVEKKQLRAFWFWKKQKEVPWILTVSGDPDDFFANFENIASIDNKFKFSYSDLLEISDEFIHLTSGDQIHLKTTTFLFRHTFDWVTYLTVFPIEQKVAIIGERNGEKFSLLKLSNCHELRIYENEKKVLEILAGDHLKPNIRSFLDLREKP